MGLFFQSLWPKSGIVFLNMSEIGFLYIRYAGDSEHFGAFERPAARDVNPSTWTGRSV